MATVPSAPTITSVTVTPKIDGEPEFSVDYVGPASDGGSPIFQYVGGLYESGVTSVIITNPYVFSETEGSRSYPYNATYRAIISAQNAIGVGPPAYKEALASTDRYTVYLVAPNTVRVAFDNVTMPAPPQLLDIGGALYPATWLLWGRSSGGATISVVPTSITQLDPYTFELVTSTALSDRVILVETPNADSSPNTLRLTNGNPFEVKAFFRNYAPPIPTLTSHTLIGPEQKVRIYFTVLSSSAAYGWTDVDYSTDGGVTLYPATVGIVSVTEFYAEFLLPFGVVYDVSLRLRTKTTIPTAYWSGTWSTPMEIPVGVNTPTEPTITSVTPGDSKLTVAFTPPANDGGSPITGYEYSISGGGAHTAIGTTSPFDVTGLTNGFVYTLILRAVNANGEGQWSLPASGTPAPSISTPPTMFARGDRIIRVSVYSPTSGAPPIHVSSTGEGDALNPRSWNALQLHQPPLGGGKVLTCMSVAMIDAWTYDILLLEPFQRLGSSYAYSSTVTAYLSGTANLSGVLKFEDLTSAVIYQNFNITIAASDATANSRAAAKGLVLKDLANVSITPIGSLFGGAYSEFISGTLVINSSGDYVSVSGEAMVRKLIMRRLLSRKGDFFHLPNYGAGMDIKSVFSTANLRMMAKDIEMQVLLEPEIEAAKATLTYQVANSILIIQVQARMRSTGQQTSLSLSLPLSGTTQF